MARYGRRDRDGSNLTGRSRESANWFTPLSQDSKHSGVNPGKNSERNLLVNQVNWPTPRAQKTASPDTCGNVPEELLGKILNPDWVEQMMGLPVGWTQLSDAKPGENRIDRLRLLGSGVVPQTAEKAFRVLFEKLQKPRDIQKTFEDYI